MSTTYGPIIFPGPGVIVPINISAAATAILIENQSLSDVLFSVSAAQPIIVTQAIAAAQIAAGLPVTTGGWDLHIGPRMSGVLQIPSDYLTDSPKGRYWTGIMWAQQVTVTNALVTAGSFISQPGPNVWVTGYGPGEQIPQEGLTSIGFFLASQERVVSVPVIGSIVMSAVTSNTATGIWESAAIANIGNFPFSNNGISSGLTSPGLVTALLYSCAASMLPLSSTAGVAEGQDFLLRFSVHDSSSAVVGFTGTLFRAWMAHLSFQSMASMFLAYPSPMGFGFTVAAGTGPPYALSLDSFVDVPFGGGGTLIKRVIVQLSCDLTPLAPDGPGGGVNGLTNGSTYNGFVY